MKAKLLLILPLLFTATQIAQAQTSISNQKFWETWGDGKAEMSAYETTFPRYGELRNGVAVAIVVTETFSEEVRVKADPGKHLANDEIPVIKLNFVEDFPTGIYDYNLMTSSFSALKPFSTFPQGTPMKISFSSQEWCGHVYSQIIPRNNEIQHTSHSYFDGEADQNETLPWKKGGITEDSLLLWARGLSR